MLLVLESSNGDCSRYVLRACVMSLCLAQDIQVDCLLISGACVQKHAHLQDCMCYKDRVKSITYSLSVGQVLYRGGILLM